jgi:hypothetical protein
LGGCQAFGRNLRPQICPVTTVRFKIRPAMLVRVNFAEAEFKSLPIEHNFGSPWAFTKPVGARRNKRSESGDVQQPAI